MARQHCQTELINHTSSSCNFSLGRKVAAPFCLATPVTRDPFQPPTHAARPASSVMAMQLKKERLITRAAASRTNGNYNISSLKTETIVLICLVCQKSVAVAKEFNIKRHYQTNHANAYDKFTGSDRSEKLKQLEAVLASQQRLFTQARESNLNSTKASYKVAILIAKRGKPFTEGEFIKDCVMKMVDNIFPEKKQEFANVCLARNTVAWRIEEISSDIRHPTSAAVGTH